MRPDGGVLAKVNALPTFLQNPSVVDEKLSDMQKE